MNGLCRSGWSAVHSVISGSGEMPIGIPIIAALIGAATTTGLALSGATTPSTPKSTTPTTATPAGPTPSQVQAAVTPQALNIESLTGGSVSPDYLAQIAPIQGGIAPGSSPAIQQVINSILGTQTTPSGLTGGGTLTGGSATTFSPTGVPGNPAALAAVPGFSDWLQKMAGAA